ncbi:MAG: response regulator [Nitrospiraceae bacterium]|nr:MAG: response regulator [Nitrospiraceae bacterium]
MASSQEKTPLGIKGKILFMEDEDFIRKTVSKILTQLGYEVELAREGDEAILCYKTAQTSLSPFDIIIMDLTIRNGMGGLETMSRLLEIDPEVKVILASGHIHDPVTINYKNYGFSGVITKPFEIEQLHELLTSVLNQVS